MTICCGLFCTASKILGALQAILHITCIFGVLQPPKCGSSVKKNTGLDFSSALLRAAPPMAAPRARPVRRSGRRSEKGGVLPPRALFRAKTPLFQSRRGQKPPLFRAARRPPESAAALTWENVPVAKRSRNSQLEKPSFWRKRSQPWQKEGLFRDGTGRRAEKGRAGAGGRRGQRGAPWGQREAKRGSARQRRRN